MIKIYYKLSFKLLSPLALSNGTGKTTDKDLLLGSDGKPYIPGTAMAGLLRSCLPKEEAKKLFGTDRRTDKDEKKGNGESLQNSVESKIITYDALLVGESSIEVRDGVGLDERKTAKKGSKFNFEVVERGSQFVTYLEVDSDEEAEKIESKLLPAIKTFTVGSKSTRGYGQAGLTHVLKKTFDDTNFDSWLDFSVFKDESWDNSIEVTIDKCPAEYIEIGLGLAVNGSFIIRRYTTDVSDNNSNPDYYTLKSGKTPVIPGTSWAGAFRSHMKNLARVGGYAGYEYIDSSLFGYVNENDKTSARSKIHFSESVVNNGEEKTITRNSIDRFTGGAKDAALFTETVWYGGDTFLTIRIEYCHTGKKDKNYFDKNVSKLLAAAVCDLNSGLLSVGGETSVGRGMFKVNEVFVNGEKTDVDYAKICDAINKAIKLKEANPHDC